MKRTLQLLALMTVTMCAYAQWPADNFSLPAYHTAAPRAAQKPILSGEQLTGEFFDHTYQADSYRMAAAYGDVFYQVPCYCRCDLALGHKSLRSCFENLHGASCAVCMQEAAYVYQKMKAGMTTAQIRAGVERGEYILIDLNTLKL